MRLTLTSFLSLDGVMQAPGGQDEDTSDGFQQGGWLVPYADDAMGTTVVEWLQQADAFLLGRRTYEIFASYWPKVTDPADPIAGPLNRLPKHVASRTLTETSWSGAQLIAGDVPTQVAALKRRPGRDLQVHGSGKLAQTLMQHGLIDEYRLLTAPVVLGAGRRLFDDVTRAAALRLTRDERTASGIVINVFEPAGEPAYGTFDPPS